MCYDEIVLSAQKIRHNSRCISKHDWEDLCGDDSH